MAVCGRRLWSPMAAALLDPKPLSPCLKTQGGSDAHQDFLLLYGVGDDRALCLPLKGITPSSGNHSARSPCPNAIKLASDGSALCERLNVTALLRAPAIQPLALALLSGCAVVPLAASLRPASGEALVARDRAVRRRPRTQPACAVRCHAVAISRWRDGAEAIVAARIRDRIRSLPLFVATHRRLL